MATVDSATRAGPTSGASVYDGFISYSHAADDLLAPRLQAGLQRFAKPWWKRRALRMFRDEASLSANPHLWSSITEAMAQSEWFVLLLSEDAAESVWVEREVAWWLKHKDPSRIIPVVTDGEFGWANGDISLESTAAPPSLRGVFTDEPRWVDLRFARSETQLDLRHAEFRGAIADIAAAIRGVPKDELESEEIRQHRRTIRTAWIGAVALLLLGVAAAVGASIAVDQSNEAQAQRDEAQVQRDEAQAQRDEAERQEAIANQERDRAEAGEALARSRELAASAINVLDEDPELSVLLALQAAAGADPTFESVSALHEALQQHRTVRTLTWPEAWWVNPGMIGSISPHGRYVASSGANNQLAVWNLEMPSDDPIWDFEVLPWPDHALIMPWFNIDGSRVIVTVSWFNVNEPAELWPEPPPEVGIYVFDVRTGEILEHFRGPRCPFKWLFQSGRFLDTTRLVGASAPVAEDCSLDHGANLWLIDLTTGDMTLAQKGPVVAWPWDTAASLSADGRLMSFLAGSTIENSTDVVIDLETGREVFATEGGGWFSVLTKDGSELLVGGADWIALWDVASGTQSWHTESTANLGGVWFSPDEATIYGAAHDGAIRFWDAETGNLIRELKGHGSFSWFASMTLDGTRLASFAGEGTARIWDLSASAEGELGGFELPGVPRLQSGKVVGNQAAILLYPENAGPADEGLAVVFDVLSGEVRHTFSGYGGQMVRLSPDGTLLAGQPFASPGVLDPVHIRDVASGQVLVELEGLCSWDAEHLEPGSDCAETPGAVGDSVWWIDFSPDGSMVAIGGDVEEVAGVWDVQSGQHLTWLTGLAPVPVVAGQDGVIVQFSPDSELLLTATSELSVFSVNEWAEVATAPIAWGWWDIIFTPDGRHVIGADVAGVVTIDTATWDYIGEPLPTTEGAARDIAINPSGSLMASAGADAVVLIWSLDTLELVQTIPLGDTQVTLVEFIDDTHLLVIPQDRPALLMTIDVAELIELARAQVTRGFTEVDCAKYHIDPCPTLDDIQAGRP